MKINFSNLAKLFLAGVCFVAVGCTDYGQDIESLNNRITALETETIAPLAADLKTVQDDLKDAKKDLQDQIDIHEGLIKNLTDDLATAQGDLKTHKDLIDGLTTDLTKVEGDLKTTNDKIDNAVKEINGKIATLDKSVADLKAKDEAFAKQIADLDVAVKNNTAKIEELTKGLADEVKAREELQKALNDHLAIYATFVKDVDAKFQALNLEVEALKAKDVELQGLIDALDVRLKANEALAEQNKKDIAQNAADIKANKELLDATIETLELLQAAHAALETRVGNLETAFDEYQKAIRAELDAHYAAFTAYTEKTDKAIADLVAENQAQQIAIEANLAAINNIKDVEIPALQAAIKEQADALVAAKAELQGNIDALAKVVEDYKTEMATIISGLDGRITENANQIKLTQESVKALKADLQAQIDKIDARVKTLEDKLAALEAKVQSLIDNEIKALQDGMNALRGRIQSLVFVPEYTDGKATIEWAKLGDAIVEGQSVLKYQVFPANCAASVTKEHLTFLFEPLKTRAAAEPVLNVVGVQVVDEAKGIIAVTVNARNLADNFYQPDNNGATNYAVSLVLDDKANVNLASCYVNLTPAVVKAITVEIINDDEVYEIPYTTINTPTTVLPDHKFAFAIDGKGSYTIEGMLDMGYDLKVKKFDPTYVVTPEDKPNVFKNEKSETESEYLTFTAVSLKEAKKEAVGLREYVTYTYEISGKALGAHLTAESHVTVTKVKGTIDLALAKASGKINWDYVDDARSDAGLENPNSFDEAKITATVLPEDHSYLTTIAEEIKDGKVTKYRDHATVVKFNDVNGAVANGVSVEFGLKIDSKTGKYVDPVVPTITINNFAWNKTYYVESTYDLPSIIVTVRATIETVDRDRKVIKVTLLDSEKIMDYETTYSFDNSLVKAEDLKDNGATIFQQIVANKTFDADKLALNADYKDVANKEADFLKEVLVTKQSNKWTESNTLVNTVLNILTGEVVSTSTMDATAKSGLSVHTNGVGATVKFSYVDVTVMPDVVKHVYAITTWYGQEIVIEKTVKLARPSVYDFQHVTEWVKIDVDNVLYSKVLPEYYYNNGPVSSLYSFNTKKVDMESAFDVVLKNADGTVVELYKDVEEAEAAHISQIFVVEPTKPNLKSEFNGLKLDYQDYKYTSVDVYGSLYYNVKVGNGDETYAVKLVTSFDKKQQYDYTNYYVRRCEPESDFSVVDGTLYLDNAIEYNIDVLSRVKLMDNRTYGGQGKYYQYSLLQYTVGDQTVYSRDEALSIITANDKTFDLSDIRATFTVGNGENGFAPGLTADAVYLPFVVVSELDIKSVPAGLRTADGKDLDKTKIRWEPTTHRLTILGTAQLNLTEKFDLDFTVSLKHQDDTYIALPLTITVKPKNAPATPAE